MKTKYIFLGVMACLALTFGSCGNIMQDVDFTVSLSKENTYNAGQPVVFNFVNAPDWVTFYSGETGKTHPDGKGIGIKGITDGLYKYTYTYSAPGTYEATFLGGNTNFEGSKTAFRKVTVVIK